MKVNGMPDGYCSKFFSALANRLRIRILQELSLKPMTVNELAEKLGSERTLVSHNLSILAGAELASFEKDGKKRVYRANEDIVPSVFFLLERIVCSRCSIRKVCLSLKEKELPGAPQHIRPACLGCK
jgi:DNA-binding transcriptional ArsR family regulator